MMPQEATLLREPTPHYELLQLLCVSQFTNNYDFEISHKRQWSAENSKQSFLGDFRKGRLLPTLSRLTLGTRRAKQK